MKIKIKPGEKGSSSYTKIICKKINRKPIRRRYSKLLINKWSTAMPVSCMHVLAYILFYNNSLKESLLHFLLFLLCIHCLCTFLNPSFLPVCICLRYVFFYYYFGNQAVQVIFRYMIICIIHMSVINSPFDTHFLRFKRRFSFIGKLECCY